MNRRAQPPPFSPWEKVAEGRMRVLAGGETLAARNPKEQIEHAMMPNIKFVLRGKALDSYLELVLAFPLSSIHSEDHLAEAHRVMDRLLVRGALDVGQGMYLDALSDLVALYEDEHHAIEPASDADMLRHLMEAKGVVQAQVSQGTGIAKSTISEVLAGRKRFSRQMIRKLAEYFGTDVSVLAGNL